ncbi:hypothetical protein FGB62_50g01 [Gracilaria domingensis]|nr:hypothetical protein FGB62_50g01 [Gracilaria domingensis]
MVRGVTLPKSRAVNHLFRVQDWKERSQQSNKGTPSLLTDVGSVDSVYGMQKPLGFEILLTLGTLCAPRKAAVANMSSKQLLRKGLSLDEIVPRDPEAVPYLQEQRSMSAKTVLHQAFLYGSHAIDGTFPASYAFDAKIVHIVFSTPTEGVSFNVERIGKKTLKARREQREENSEENSKKSALSLDFNFTLTAVRAQQKSWAELHR